MAVGTLQEMKRHQNASAVTPKSKIFKMALHVWYGIQLKIANQKILAKCAACPPKISIESLQIFTGKN